jgi:hypothetical protein
MREASTSYAPTNRDGGYGSPVTGAFREHRDTRKRGEFGVADP